MGCSITFEQTYGGIDGDSASSTEVYAIVSALAELPLRNTLPSPVRSTSTVRFRSSAASTRRSRVSFVSVRLAV